MKKVLKGMPTFSALGFKKQLLALAVCVSVGVGVISKLTKITNDAKRFF